MKVSYLLMSQTLLLGLNGEASLPQFISELHVQRNHKILYKSASMLN